ncbi:MAG: hypothetical protein J5441_07030 [Clostridia bacterium]|nr:hypothetical protein [Clostridia bacterium]
MKFKRLIPALAMLLVSAILLGTSTFAWFSMNNQVTATGMKVQAVAEGGIEIRYNVLATGTDDNTAYSYTDDAGMTTATALRPTSTAATGTASAITSKWLHASAASTDATTAKAGTYVDLTAAAGWSDGVISNNPATDLDGNYYVVKEFNIRSTSDAALAKNLRVKAVDVTGSTNSPDLDKALRVAIIANAQCVVYAPLGGDASNTVGTGVGADGNRSGTTTVSNLAPTSVGNLYATANETVPAKDTTNSKFGGVDVRIYIYFEGEATELYTDNIYASLNELDIEVTFEAE